MSDVIFVMAITAVIVVITTVATAIAETTGTVADDCTRSRLRNQDKT